MNKRCFSLILSALCIGLLAACASSERMTRMSGGVAAKYSAPSGIRLSSAKFRTAEKAQDRSGNQTPGDINRTLINIWPFFFRNSQYISVLWPMIDYDRYGFAVRPFYNQEGDDYSVLFPFCAWNPAKKHGWLIPAYWNEHIFGVFPLVHAEFKPDKSEFLSPLYIHTTSRIKPPLRFYTGRPLKKNYNMFLLTGYYGQQEFLENRYGINPALYRERPSLNMPKPEEAQFRLALHQCGEKAVFPKTLKEYNDACRKLAVYRKKLECKYGFFPLFSWTEKPEEQKFSLLLLLANYQKLKYSTSYNFFCAMFHYHEQKNQLQQYQLKCIDGGWSAGEKFLLLLPLLSWDSRKEIYTSTAKTAAAGQIAAHQRTYPLLKQRAEYLKQLRIINPDVQLPDFVNDEEIFKLWYLDFCRKQTWATKQERAFGCAPLFWYDYSVPAKTEFLFLPALLSKWERTSGRSTLLMIPLISYFLKSEQYQFDGLLMPFGWIGQETKRKRERCRIYDSTDKSVQKWGTVRHGWAYYLCGLGYKEEDGYYCAKAPYQAKELNQIWQQLNALSLHIENAEKREKNIRLRESKKWIRRTKIEEYRYLIELEEIRIAKEELEKFRKNTLDAERIKIREMFKKNGIQPVCRSWKNKNDINRELDALFDRCTMLASVTRYGTGLLWQRERWSNGDLNWYFLNRLIASGSRTKDLEDSHILQFCYRHKRSGNKSETLYFPFISVQKDGNNERVSFLWRVWERKTVNGKTSGHFLFIPY